MTVTRRGFLKWSTVLWALTRWLPVAAASQSKPVEDKTLAAWLDTLIPADETPSATQLGVDRMMLDVARNDPDYQVVLGFGRKWLDAQARARGAADFAALDPAAREVVVAQAAAAGKEAPEYYFFQATQHEALGFYYTQPGSWPGLGYRGPPQPLGYMDYTRKPGGGGDD